MDYYRGTTVIDDPHLGGRTAYAYIEVGIGAHAYWLHLMTAEQVQERIGKVERELTAIGPHPANGFQREQKADALQTLTRLRQAMDDLAAAQTFEGPQELKIRKSFNKISGIFKDDGLVTVDIPGRGLTALTALRQKMDDGRVIRRYEDLRGLDRLFHVEANKVKQLDNSLVRLEGAEARAARVVRGCHQNACDLIEKAKNEATGTQKYIDGKPQRTAKLS